MHRITSRQNPSVARYRAAARGDDPVLMLLDGPHLVSDALDAGISLEHVVVCSDRLGDAEGRALYDRLTRQGVAVAEAAPAVMSALSPVRSPSAIVALGTRPIDGLTRAFSAPAPWVVATCDVQDPGNIGAVIRAAEAGGASGVVTCGRSADPFGWKALRGSMGSALRLPVARESSVDRLFDLATRARCRLVAAVARGGRDPAGVPLDGPTLLLVGGEGSGLAPALVSAADDRITIPMAPPVESLNTATAAALLVYEGRRQRLQRLAGAPHGHALSTRSRA